MKTPRLSRRQFLKVAAFGTSALALPAISLAAVAALPLMEAQAATQQPNNLAIPQPTFTPIVSTGPFGPVTDINMGWDGVLRGVDASGAPHLYDAVSNAWQQMGDGIDAVAQLAGVLYVFKGPELVTVSLTTAGYPTSAVTTIASQWPNLPDSFKLGITGATNFNNQTLILFNGGRYISTNGDFPVTNLDSLLGWPTTDSLWTNGVMTGAFCSPVGDDIILLSGNEYLTMNLVGKYVSTPAPISGSGASMGFSTYLPAAWQTSGFDGGFVYSNTYFAFKGTAMLSYTLGGAQPTPVYIGATFGNWPATWHPSLLHAPSGRDGALWSVSQAAGFPTGTGQVIRHNGDVWSPVANTIASSISAGQDGTAIQVNPASGSMWMWNGVGWDALGTNPSQLIQISVGNLNEIWVRDTNNNVYSFDVNSNAFTQSVTIGQATHIAATHDGTVWHTKANDTNAHRLLTGPNLLQPDIPVQQGVVTSVNKISGTGFGLAYCLTTAGSDTKVYRYDSPYLFKSQHGFLPIPGSKIETGLGMLYFTNLVNFSGGYSPVYAMDAHTGAVVSQSAGIAQPIDVTGYTPPVFDPLNELVYVGVTQPPVLGNSVTGSGQILALDARDLSTFVWSYTTPAPAGVALSVIGNWLIASDQLGHVYQFDTVATRANPSQPNPVISFLPNAAGIDVTQAWSMSRLAAVDGMYYAVVWQFKLIEPDVTQIYVVGIDPITSPPTFINSYIGPSSASPATFTANPMALADPPVVGLASDGSPFLVINAITSVYQLFSDGFGSLAHAFTLPNSSALIAGLTIDTDTNQVWFGDGNSFLYCLDATFNLVNHTPAQITTQGPIAAAPVVYRDAGGNKTIFVGVLQNSTADEGFLYGFDPVTGNIASLVTGDTAITSFSRLTRNGVIYIGGNSAGGDTTLTQIFGLRVDEVVQATRDFIIENQLMQDPDESQTGHNGNINPNDPPPLDPIPPSTARYQTHISVVDDQKSPQINEPLKVWADMDGIIITVNNQSYTIGPADEQFAAIVTGIDGTVVIVSDADDINASALRVWAGFMDPYERIVVYPDHEWHGRVLNSYNDSKAVPSQPDPNRPNFSTVQNYSGTALFTADEVTKGFPAQLASALNQMKTGVNPGGNGAAALAGSLKTVHASNSAASYIAYSDLGSMHYAAANALAVRNAMISAPFGLQFGTDASGNTTYTPMSHSDARSAIDAMDGAPWDPNNPDNLLAADLVAKPAAIRSVDGFFSSFWHWIKHAVDTTITKVESVAVSVGTDITVGIVYIYKGVKRVFKDIIKTLDDVVNAIGSFFLQFGKLIEDVIEALSLLLHFGEIIWTHKWLRDAINQEILGLAAAVKNQTEPLLNNFFKTTESALLFALNTIRNQFGSSTINNLRGSGTTAHSMFTVNSSSGGSSSQAVPCNYGIQKLKAGISSASSSSFATRAQSSSSPGVSKAGASKAGVSKAGASKAGASPQDFPGGSEIAQFISGFVDRITGDGDLAATFGQLQNDLSNLIHPSSAKQFLTSALSALIDILETLITGVLAVTKDFFDGLAGIVDDVVNILMAVLDAPIDIPFLSWLFKLVFGEDLTILNVVTLVAAIPITFIYRVTTGDYPSQAGLPAANTLPNGATPTQAAQHGTKSNAKPNAVQLSPGQVAAARILGGFNGVLIVVGGIFNAYNDSLSDTDPIPAGIACAISTVVACLSVPVLYSNLSSISGLDWTTWTITALLGLGTWLGLVFTESGPVLSFLFAMGNLGLLILTVDAFVTDFTFNWRADVDFTANIFSVLPGIANPIKNINEFDVGPIIVATVDFVVELAWGGLVFFTSISTPSATLPVRVYVPTVHNQAPIQLQPPYASLAK